MVTKFSNSPRADNLQVMFAQQFVFWLLARINFKQVNFSTYRWGKKSAICECIEIKLIISYIKI